MPMANKIKFPAVKTGGAYVSFCGRYRITRLTKDYGDGRYAVSMVFPDIDEPICGGPEQEEIGTAPDLQEAKRLANQTFDDGMYEDIWKAKGGVVGQKPQDPDKARLMTALHNLVVAATPDMRGNMNEDQLDACLQEARQLLKDLR
jgi:hypothetical protein